MAVGTYALSTRAELKSHLGITATTDDTILDGYIDQATAQIERYIGRNILVREYAQWYGLNGTNAVRLKQYPVNHVGGVYTGFITAFTVASSVPSDLRATISVSTESLGTGIPSIVLHRTAVGGASTQTTLSLATYTDVSDLCVAISAVAGFTATLAVDMRTKQLHPRAGGDCRYSTVLMTGATLPSEFHFDSDLGIVYLRKDLLDLPYGGQFPLAATSCVIDYSAGYDTVPPDIHLACMQMAATAYLSRKADASVTSESLGDYSYSRATGEAAEGIVAHLLGSWREPR